MEDDQATRDFRGTTFTLLQDLSRDVKALGQADAGLTAQVSALRESILRMQTMLIDDTRNSVLTRLTQIEEQCKNLIAELTRAQVLSQESKANIEKELDKFREDLARLTEQLRSQGAKLSTPTSLIREPQRSQSHSPVAGILALLSDQTIRWIVVSLATAALGWLGVAAVNEGTGSNQQPSTPSSPTSSE